VTQPGSVKKQAARLAGVYKPGGAKKFPTCAQKRPPAPARRRQSASLPAQQKRRRPTTMLAAAEVKTGSGL